MNAQDVQLFRRFIASINDPSGRQAAIKAYQHLAGCSLRQAYNIVAPMFRKIHAIEPALTVTLEVEDQFGRMEG